MDNKIKHHRKYFVRGGLKRKTSFKQQANNTERKKIGRFILPESWETLTHESHRFTKERKQNQAHTDTDTINKDTTGMGIHQADSTPSI